MYVFVINISYSSARFSLNTLPDECDPQSILRGAYC